MSNLTDRISELVHNVGSVSFVEMERRINGWVKGDHAMVIENDRCSNIVLWVNLGFEVIEAFNELKAGGAIHPKPSSYMIYLIDGGTLNMPLVKSMRHYKKPHWLPVVFNKGPGPQS